MAASKHRAARSSSRSEHRAAPGGGIGISKFQLDEILGHRAAGAELDAVADFVAHLLQRVVAGVAHHRDLARNRADGARLDLAVDQPLEGDGKAHQRFFPADLTAAVAASASCALAKPMATENFFPITCPIMNVMLSPAPATARPSCAPRPGRSSPSIRRQAICEGCIPAARAASSAFLP